jgi:hypothetical protein
MKESRNASIILHCHIPKTAGTTVSAGLRRSFEIFHLYHCHPDPVYILTREVLERLLEIYPALASISSHHLRSFPLSIRGRPTFLVTFLRKPEDAFISQLKYAQRRFSTFSPQVQRLWPKETPRLPLRELARQYLDLVVGDQDFCPQTRFFCSPSAMAKFGLHDGHGYGVNSYEIARSILQQFHFVGIVDEMKKSLELLTDRLAQRNVRVYFDTCGRQNCSPEKAKPTWMTLDDDVGRRVLQASKSDLLLYHHFRDALLASHEELRKRCWLGFKPATADAIEAFKGRGLHEAERSLVNSGRLFWRRQGLGCTRAHNLDWELSSEVLEERVARAFAEKAQRRMAEKLVQSE